MSRQSHPYDIAFACDAESMNLFWPKIRPIYTSRWIHLGIDPSYGDAWRWLQQYQATQARAKQYSFQDATNKVTGIAVDLMRANMGEDFFVRLSHHDPGSMAIVPSSVWDVITDTYNVAVKHKDKGCVYFLHAKEVGLVKIGYSINPLSKRMGAVHSHCPYDLELLGVVRVPNGITSERKLHKELQKFRHNREWFRYEEELAAKISALVSVGHYDNSFVDVDYGSKDFLKLVMRNQYSHAFKMYNDIYLTHAARKPKHAIDQSEFLSYDEFVRINQLYWSAEDPAFNFRDVLRLHAPVAAYRFVESLITDV